MFKDWKQDFLGNSLRLDACVLEKVSGVQQRLCGTFATTLGPGVKGSGDSFAYRIRRRRENLAQNRCQRFDRRLSDGRKTGDDYGTGQRIHPLMRSIWWK